jgi:hypothetical protein
MSEIEAVPSAKKWALLQSRESEPALKQLKEEYSRFPRTKERRWFVAALLWSGRYEVAAEELERVIAVGVHSVSQIGGEKEFPFGSGQVVSRGLQIRGASLDARGECQRVRIWVRLLCRDTHAAHRCYGSGT